MSARPKFFADRCLGKIVPLALREAGAHVELHDDHFPEDFLDEDWIPLVAARDWVILTKDKRIRRRFRERQAVVFSQARVFTLASGTWSSNETAAVLTSHLEAMEILALALQPPFVAVVSRSGIEIVYPRPES